MDNELDPIETQTAILVNSINQQANGELERGIAEMASIQRRILVIVPATALATFLIAAFFGWSIARRVIEVRVDERVAERTRIARELHDTMLQNFQASLIYVHVARDLLSNQPEKAGESLDEAISVAFAGSHRRTDCMHAWLRRNHEGGEHRGLRAWIAGFSALEFPSLRG